MQDTLITFSKISIITLIVSVIYLISLAFFKIGIERHLLSDTQKILMHSIRVLFLSIYSGLLYIYAVELYTGDNIRNYNDDEIINFFMIGILTAFLFVAPIYYVVSFFGRKKYYINYEIDNNNKRKIYLKLYIIKQINKDLILLCNKIKPDNDSIQILENKSFLKGKHIYTDSKKKKQN